MIPWAVVILIGPIFFQHLGFDGTTANLIVLLAQTANIIGAIFAGWYGDRLVLKSQRKRIFFVSLFILLALPFFFTAFLLPYPTVGPEAGFGVFWSIPIFPLGFILLNIGSFFAASAGGNWYAIIEDVNEPETRSTIISFHTLTDRIGNALGPILAAVMGPILAVSGSQGDALIVAIAILFWIPCAVLWFFSMRSIEQDVHEMKTLLKERAKELEQGLKSN